MKNIESNFKTLSFKNLFTEKAEEPTDVKDKASSPDAKYKWPQNINTEPQTESFPGEQGLPEPSQVGAPERTTGNGRGGFIAVKNFTKNASFIKRAFSMFPNFGGGASELDVIISAIMADPKMSFDEKDKLISYIKTQPPSILSELSKIAGATIGGGVGFAIANYLLGAGKLGSILGTLAGAYIGNNLQNRYNMWNNSPLSANPFETSFNPSNLTF